MLMIMIVMTMIMVLMTMVVMMLMIVVFMIVVFMTMVFMIMVVVMVSPVLMTSAVRLIGSFRDEIEGALWQSSTLDLPYPTLGWKEALRPCLEEVQLLCRGEVSATRDQ